MPELFLSIPLAILILLACHEAGRIVLLKFNPCETILDPLNRTIFRFAVGFVSVEFLLTILGSVHLLYPWLMWVVLIGLIISLVIFGRKEHSLTLVPLKAVWKECMGVPLNAILIWVVVVALAMDFILTMVPTTAWDALTYHYPLPMEWLRNGGFKFDEVNAYSELPMSSEMLFCFAFGLGGISDSGLGIGHLSANHLTWAAGVLSILTFISIGRNLGADKNSGLGGNRNWNSFTPGLIAAVAFLSLPIVYVEEMEGGYIENFIVFLSITSLIALLNFRENKSGQLIIIIGILSGGLLACKHSNILLCVILLLILIVWIIMSKDRKNWKYLVGAILLAIIIPFPWYLKSYLHTGDPAWPMLTKLLHPEAQVPDIMYWSNPNVERSIFGFITYIPRLTFDVSLVQLDFRLLTWYFLPLLPFVIYWSIASKKARPVELITWFLILMIYILAPGEPRYMLAVWGIYIALGSWALLKLLDRIPWATKYLLPILLIIPIAFSMSDRTKEINNRIPTIIGLASIDQYFEKSYDIWPLIKYINEETDPDARIVLVDPRVMYVQRDYVAWYPFPTPMTKDWEGSDNPPPYSEWLENDLDYVLLSYGPNYRALTLAKFAGHPQLFKPYNSITIPEFSAWLGVQASYAEPSLLWDDNGYLGYNGEIIDRIEAFDVQSILQLNNMCEALYIEPIYIDENSGILFHVIKPDEREDYPE
ncbi:MAG: hypothetical protein NTY09_14160 [bacterium]|nr:hypothetical protein [bacterium]